MPVLQELIHRLEVGGGLRSFGRYFYITLGALLVLLLLAGYNFRAYKNFYSMEAMDTAQLGRNLAEGRGYTTQFVRPFSMYLCKEANPNWPGADGRTDPFRIRGPHPDISNPPVYPVVLAGLMKALPFNYETERTNWFWSVRARASSGSNAAAAGRTFYRYQPEFLIALFNQALFAVCIVLTFFLARRLFDSVVAWVSALVMLGTELLWRFSVSGLSTMLLMLLVLGLAWVVVRLDEEISEERPAWRGWLLAALLGLLTGLGGLTRYSFAWMILPVIGWLLVFGGKQRWVLGVSGLVTFLLVLTPWIVRNIQVSGTPFGTASYALIDGGVLFPEFKLQRSVSPPLEFSQQTVGVIVHKLVTNSRELVESELPRIGGNWVSAFFLTGLLIGYRKMKVRRLRYFLVGSLVMLALAQVLSKTYISEAQPVVNTENLLVLLTPLLIVFGVSLFFLLLDTVELPVRELRMAAIGAFALMTSLPLVLTLLPPSTMPFAWPPYHPPTLQKVGSWMKPGELTMSDIPWAIAWYGNRQSAWLTLNSGKDFLAINDYQKPVQLLFLSRLTLESKLYSDVVHGGRTSWGDFLLLALLGSKIPPGFPLQTAAPNYLPEFLILTDWERWRKPGDSAPTATPAQP